MASKRNKRRKEEREGSHYGHDKAMCERLHAARRCEERFGFRPSMGELKGVEKQIQTRTATFIDRQTNRVSRWRVSIRETECRVVYDGNRHRVVTFLPPDGVNT